MSAAVMIFSSMLIPIREPNLPRKYSTTTSVKGSGTEWWDQSLVEWLSKTHPETARSVNSQRPERRPYCMHDISDIIRKLGHKRTLSDAELSRTSDKLANLTRAGIDVEWLGSKLEMKKREAYLERKKRDACEARIVELKQEVKKLELAKSVLKAELKNEKAKLNTRWFRRGQKITKGRN